MSNRFEIDKETQQQSNREAIRNTFLSLLQRRELAIGVNEMPIQLSDGFLRAVYISNGEVPDMGRILSITTRLYKNEEVVAYRDYGFDLEEDGEIHVYSFVGTVGGFESRGYGSGLILLTEPVIVHAQKRYDALQGRRLITEISDTANGRSIDEGGFEKDRLGWSSYHAAKLGFEEVNSVGSYRQWTKVL